MKKPTVSIIVPVYKTEQYLKECIDSILKQDYPAIEIILIDDGSPDNCPALCDWYARQYPNIQSIHQNNAGLGLSRNTGMDASSGKYIFFLDSDDCMDGAHAISRLAAEAEANNADIVTGSFRRFHGKTISETNFHHLRDGNYTKTVDFRFKGFYMYGHLAYNWGKLYRKSFLKKHNLKCRAYPFTQDKAHNTACCACSPVYAFIPDSVYLYRVNEGSVTFRYKENFMPVWISIASDFQKFLKERRIKGNYGDLMAFHIFFGSFFLVKQELQYKEHGIRSSVKMLKHYGKHPFVRKAMAALAKGRYVGKISPITWKLVIRTTAIFFTLHLYWPLACGIALLRKLQIDERITKARYKDAKKKTQ